MQRSRWTVLALLGSAELLGMSLWFTASAVAPHFRDLWSLTPSETAWLTTVVQLGFVAGTALAAALNLADVLPSRVYFATAALLAAAANAALVAAPSFAVAITLRFMTGLLLAGVYPPAMKMIATWFQSARGFAIGTIVGALTLGKAMPYLLSAFRALSYGDVILLSSAGATAGGLLVAFAYRDGPYPFPRRAFSWSLVGTVLSHGQTRLAIAAYLGHMWELYAMWSLVSMFFFDYFIRAGESALRATTASGVAAFSVIAVGAAGCVIAGWWADVWGRERVTMYAMAMSGTCALLIGHMLASPLWLIVIVALLWGFSIVADSAQFSALVTEIAPAHAVGTALTLQTSLGFLLTAIAIPTTLAMVKSFGWPAAFSLLAIGPALGIVAMLRLKSARAWRD